MKTVILDTNFLLIPHQFRIDVLREIDKLLEEAHRIVVSEPIMAELRGLAAQRGKGGVAARVALEGIKKKGIEVMPSEIRNGDEWIVDYAGKNPGTIVCTNDIELRRRLRKSGARVIVMRTRTKIFWQ